MRTDTCTFTLVPSASSPCFQVSLYKPENVSKFLTEDTLGATYRLHRASYVPILALVACQTPVHVSVIQVHLQEV
jgi:hypothetical protein